MLEANNRNKVDSDGAVIGGRPPPAEEEEGERGEGSGGEETELRNRSQFEAALVGLLGPEAGPCAGSLYEVFVCYFFHQATHHNKALSAHCLTLELHGSSSSPTEGWELEYRMLGRADKGKSPFFQALQKATAANRRPLSSPSPSLSSSAAHHITRGLGTPFRQTDEKFFAVASTWLGAERCSIFKSFLRQVKIRFLATRFMGDGKKMWVEWTWMGAHYCEQGAESFLEQQVRPAQFDPPSRSLEAGTPEEGSIQRPQSAPPLPSPSAGEAFASSEALPPSPTPGLSLAGDEISCPPSPALPTALPATTSSNPPAAPTKKRSLRKKLNRLHQVLAGGH